MFAALGVPVTVVDGRERPLEFLDREIIDELDLMREAGKIAANGLRLFTLLEISSTSPLSIKRRLVVGPPSRAMCFTPFSPSC